MEDKDKEKRWKAETKQLKEDIDNRQKTQKKREVPISFWSNKKKKTPQVPSPSKIDDDWARRQLGL